LNRKTALVLNKSYFTAANLKLHNKISVLDHIRFTPEGISRADMARELGLSRAAVSLIVNDLIALKVVREAADSPATGGRPAILLEMNPACGYVLGVDMGATHLGLVLADYAARVIAEHESPFDVSLGPEICLQQIDRDVRAFLKQNDFSMDDITSIGVGVPGPVVSKEGGVVAPPIMPGWDKFPIRTHLQELWGHPITLDNDAELGALGEWAYGAGRFEPNLLYVKVGYGIGAGLLLNGKIYSGATGSAGEIGHITVQVSGPRCTCGNQGCLEAIAGGRAIAQQAAQAIQSGRRTSMVEIQPLEKLTTVHVAMEASKGDLVAQEIVMNAGQYLGIAIANLINVVNPGLIIVGGGVAQMGDLFLEPIRQAVKTRSLPAAARVVRITAAMLGRRSSGIGAVVQAISLAMHDLIERAYL
jgi:glucokinase-like ROK family protein